MEGVYLRPEVITVEMHLAEGNDDSGAHSQLLPPMTAGLVAKRIEEDALHSPITSWKTADRYGHDSIE